VFVSASLAPEEPTLWETAAPMNVACAERKCVLLGKEFRA